MKILKAKTLENSIRLLCAWFSLSEAGWKISKLMIAEGKEAEYFLSIKRRMAFNGEPTLEEFISSVIFLLTQDVEDGNFFSIEDAKDIEELEKIVRKAVKNGLTLNMIENLTVHGQ